MTVPVNDRRIQYVATAGQTIFPYDFEITDESNLEVLKTNTLGVTTTLILYSDYTVSGVGSVTGGNITLISPAASSDIITITGKTPLERNTDFNPANLRTDDLNSQFDDLFRIEQETKTRSSRALLLADEDTADSLTLPIKEVRINNFLAFDTEGNPIASSAVTPSSVPVSPFMENFLQDTDAAEGRATLQAQEEISINEGQILIGNASNQLSNLSIGSDKSFLRSNGITLNYDDAIASSTSRGVTFLPKFPKLSYNTTNRMSVADGIMTFDDGSGQAIFSSAVKILASPWIQGNNRDGLDTGTRQANTPYYIYAIYNPTTGASDVLYTASYGSPTLPSGFTKKMYIGVVVTDSSTNIRNASYYDNNKWVIYDSRIQELSNYSPGVGTHNITTTVPPMCFGIYDAEVTHNEDLNSQFMSGAGIRDSDGISLKNDWAIDNFSGGFNNRTMVLQVNSSSQIRLVITSQSGSGGINMTTNGFYDTNLM